MRTRLVVLTLWCVSVAGGAQAQVTGAPRPQAPAAPTPTSAWLVRATANVYTLPDDDDYVQPTVAADRGWLHLEARYNYEDRHSGSAFVGWNLEWGPSVTLSVTPMFGVVIGDTDGVIPALEVGLTWRSLELYSEGEYVIPVETPDDRFLYNWSEASVWLTDWIRAGVVTQRTRVYQTPRDTQWGLLAGVAVWRFEGTVYVFNPGSDDDFVVTSIGISF